MTESDTEQPQDEKELSRISLSEFQALTYFYNPSNVKANLTELLSKHAPLNAEERYGIAEILQPIIGKDTADTMSLIVECEPRVAAIVEVPQTESAPPTDTSIGNTVADITELANKLTAQLNSGNYEGIENVFNECQAYLSVIKLKMFKDMVSGKADISACNAIDKLTAALTKHRGMTKILKDQNTVSESLTELQTGERKLGVLLE